MGGGGRLGQPPVQPRALDTLTAGGTRSCCGTACRATGRTDGWLGRALSVLVLHDVATGRWTTSSAFLDEARDQGIEFTRDLTPCMPNPARRARRRARRSRT